MDEDIKIEPVQPKSEITGCAPCARWEAMACLGRQSDIIVTREGIESQQV